MLVYAYILSLFLFCLLPIGNHVILTSKTNYFPKQHQPTHRNKNRAISIHMLEFMAKFNPFSLLQLRLHETALYFFLLELFASFQVCELGIASNYVQVQKPHDFNSHVRIYGKVRPNLVLIRRLMLFQAQRLGNSRKGLTGKSVGLFSRNHNYKRRKEYMHTFVCTQLIVHPIW